jgi:hypothetical protein
MDVGSYGDSVTIQVVVVTDLHRQSRVCSEAKRRCLEVLLSPLTTMHLW